MFRFQITDIVNLSETHVVLLGELLSGRICRGDTGVLAAGGQVFVLRDIRVEMFRKEVDWVEVPDRRVGLMVAPSPLERFMALRRADSGLIRGAVVTQQAIDENPGHP